MEPCSNSSTWTNYEPDLVLYMKHSAANAVISFNSQI